MNHTEISDLTDLANFLKTDAGFVETYPDKYVIFNDYRVQVILPAFTESMTMIDIFYIPKKKWGQFRKVFAVRSEQLRSILINLTKELSEIYKPPAAVHGYIKKRNIRSNAEKHLAKKLVLSVDIRHFFENISKDMVQHTLRSFGFNAFASERLSSLVTVDGYLVQGFSTSSIISNMVALQMDDQLAGLCASGVTYTRYSDDLYFSTDDILPSISEIENIIVRNGFEVNHEKTKLMKRGTNQYVTGLTVFDSKMPRIPKRMKRNMRLELYYTKKFGFINHLIHKLNYSVEEYEENTRVKKEVDNAVFGRRLVLGGRIDFINGIEKRAADRFREILKESDDNPRS